jgi:hypothetical protein
LHQDKNEIAMPVHVYRPPAMWRLLLETYLHATPAVSRLLWRLVLDDSDKRALVEFHLGRCQQRNTTREDLKQLLEAIGPTYLISLCELAVSGGLMKRRAVKRLEDRILELTSREGDWRNES